MTKGSVVSLLAAVSLLVAGCFGGGKGGATPAHGNTEPSASATALNAYLPGVPPPPGTELFTPVELVRSLPSALELRLPSGVVVPVTLAAIGVFDCRHDCWTSVADGLEPLQASDRLCILLVERDERMVPVKLWVNRDNCS